MAIDTPYCSVEQYEARYGAVQDADQLHECLMDSTRSLATAISRRGLDPDGFDADLLMQACRQMTRRCVPDGDGADIPVGATQASFTAGPYTQQFTMSTPYSSPRVTEDELSLLGIGAGIGCGRMS